MLRGNHETRSTTAYFGFKTEVLSKYDQEVYDLIMSLFDCLPVASVINNNYLAVHGGLSPSLRYLSDFDYANRFAEPPNDGLLCDIMWSDPTTDDTGYQHGNYVPNGPRKCSYFFGKQAASEFRRNNTILSIIRAHEVQIEGYKMHYWGETAFPVVVTIFSAPEYCGNYNNKAGVIFFIKNVFEVQQFTQKEQPFFLADNMDTLAWSIPFLAEKILEMVLNLYKSNDPGDGYEDEDDRTFYASLNPREQAALQNYTEIFQNGLYHGQDAPTLTTMEPTEAHIIQKKVKAVSRMNKMLHFLRNNRNIIQKIKKTNDNKLPTGVLLDPAKAYQEFLKAKAKDQANEGRPPVY